MDTGPAVASFFFFFSLGDKPLSVILDCYHRLILVLISVCLTTPSALEDKVIHVRPHSPSCFAPFNTRCQEPCFAAVSFLHFSCFSGESREQALTRPARSMGTALSSHPAWLQSTTGAAPAWCCEFAVGSTALDFFWNCATWFVFHPPTPSLPCMNQLNPSSSLQQINTRIFPIAYCSAGCKIEFICFRRRGEKLAKQVLRWQKERVRFVVYGPRYNTSRVLCVSVLWHKFWWAMSQPGEVPGQGVCGPSGRLRRCKLQSICPNGMAERASVCP